MTCAHEPEDSPIISNRCGTGWKLLKAYARKMLLMSLTGSTLKWPSYTPPPKTVRPLHCENAAAVLDHLAEVLAMVVLGRRQHVP